ncbi:DNA repair protein RecN [Flavobacteriaceae bacterium UJ101]|nr:DNA repair protein RecN [Flavobacteriaceae bacterium UJ101]
MLTKLDVKNYALIQDLQLNLNSGFLTITGETGAGKSILLGALGMIIGNRADLKAVLNKDKKCSVEATFDIQNYTLHTFFEEFDLDYENETLIRREISASGKSRAFINDTPVSLTILQQLGKRLIDIHSQHDTSDIIQKSFQLDLLDHIANQMDSRKQYEKKFSTYTQLNQELSSLKDTLQELKNTQDYNTYLLEELQKAQFQEGEQLLLEEELELLSNAEDIKLNLSKALQIHSNEPIGLQTTLGELKNTLQQIASFDSKFETLMKRVESISIETEDIIVEIENLNETIEYNPTRIDEINDRLQLLYTLQKKHQVDTITDLLSIMDQLASKASDYTSIEEKIEKKELQKKKLLNELEKHAETLHQGRVQHASQLCKAIETILTQVEMPNAQLKMDILALEEITSTGKDDVELLFSANKGSSFNSIKKVASGGERSRLMLAIKKVMAEKQQLPTLILDEIDTGVSGKVASQMGVVMQEMAQNIQMISVTHLPQIAAKGNQHFKVFKLSDHQTTHTQVKELTSNERVQEIAQMISGDTISRAAEAQANELLGII